MAQVITPSASSEASPTDAINKADFPIFQDVEQDPFVYLDSASSSQRPLVVLEAMERYYRTSHANVHRGVYRIAEEATTLYERARTHLGSFIGSTEPATEIVFTKNATEAANLFVQGLGRRRLDATSTVLLTHLEHHANLVPWMILKEQLGFAIRYIPLTNDGLLDLSELDDLLDGVSIVGVSLASNVLGTINPLPYLSSRAHQAGAIVFGDGAQFIPHNPTNVVELGIDALCVTSHKMLGPTGIGALWARRDLLEEMQPFLGGGEMIADVRLDGFTPNVVPYKFEAGTPPIAEAVGWDAALTYLESIGMATLRQHEVELTRYALQALKEGLGDDITIFGPDDPEARGAVISFDLKGIHPHDVSQLLDQEGVCVRAGHHCAKPLMRQLGVGATARASFYLYNGHEDVDALVAALRKCQDFFR